MRVETAVRPARGEDIKTVLSLWTASRSEMASIPDRPEDLERLIADSPASLLVAERQGEIVGAVIAAWDGWRGNLYRLAVTPGSRRMGIATVLVEAAEVQLREKGARRVTALVAFEDGDAAAFWDSAGYPVDDQIGRRVRNLSGD